MSVAAPRESRSHSGLGRQSGGPPHRRCVHAVPGRARYRVARLRADADYARRVRELASAHDDCLEARVNPPAASLVVRCDRALQPDRLDELVQAILEQAADAMPLAAPTAGRPPAPTRWTRLLLPAVVAAAAAAGRVLGFTLPAPLGAAAILVSSLPIARRAYRSLRVERRLTIDVLDVAAITLTTLRGSFLAPASMIGLVEIGEAIRERTARASQRELLDLLDSISQTVWVERRGERHQVPVDEVRRGEIVVVYPGDRIPVDGRVLEGAALIDEHELTGEPMPVLREEGQLVYASTLNREGHLHIAVEHTGSETRAGRIMALMKDAPIHDTRIENYAAKVADRIVLPSLLLAGVVLLSTRNAQRAASILITDFATGIRISVPTTVLAAMTHAAHQGVVIRSGRALEQLATVDTVVFDKTGTVTQGQPLVSRVVALGDASNVPGVLALAASAEQRLTHPVAEAVIRYAAAHGVQPGRRGEWSYDIGLGVRTQIDGASVVVGSDRLMAQHGIDVRTSEGTAREDESLIYVARDGDLHGVVCYADPVREEAAGVITELRQRHGTEIHLLTGDNQRTAELVGVALGIPRAHVHGDLFPADKAAVVRRLRADGKRVAFVGDGINDLPALAYADVSVSFDSATDAARETADLVLMGGLGGLPVALSASRSALRLIRQNIGIVGGVNLAATGVAATRGLGAVTAAVVHNGSTVVAAANGLRPLLEDARRPRSESRPRTDRTRSKTTGGTNGRNA